MSARLEILRDEHGLYLPALALHLDPNKPVPRAFISHAHGDHAGAFAGGEVFASRETIALLEARTRSSCSGARIVPWDGSTELPIDPAHGGGTARISIACAGHVLGAAQLVVDHPRGRFVYTGDINLAPGLTYKIGEIVPCDAIAIESTFGLPIFRFPDRARTMDELVTFARDEIALGNTPLVVAYSLGKSQEVIAALRSANVPTIAHGAVHRMCEAYESLGVPLGVVSGELRAYAEEKKRKKDRAGGAVLVTPPRSGKAMANAVKNPRVAYVSGWALLDASVERERADRGFAISDHADFEDLGRIVRSSGAKHVTTVHGYAAELATILANEGIDARAVESPANDREEEPA